MITIQRTPPNLRFDGAGVRQYKSTTEWLRHIKEAVTTEFANYEWVTLADDGPQIAPLIDYDIHVTVHAGANEGHRVHIIATKGAKSVRSLPEYRTLLSLKTLSGIHEAMDIANWLTVALNRFSNGIHVVSTDPAQGMS